MGGKGGGGGGDDEAPEFVGDFRNLVATQGKAFTDAITALAIPDMVHLFFSCVIFFPYIFFIVAHRHRNKTKKIKK